MRTYYAFDTGLFHPQYMSHTSLHVAQVEKDTANGVFFGEGLSETPPLACEHRIDNGYPNVIFDPDCQKYRLYYTTFTNDPVSAQTPVRERANSTYTVDKNRSVSLVYAESDDGVHWVRPKLHLVDLGDGGENNVLIQYAHGTGVMMDESERDPEKRYKLTTMMDYPGGHHYMAVSFSADGLHWSTPHPWPANSPMADSHNFCFRDDTDGHYKMITRIWRNGIRVSAMCESADFLNWSVAREILSADGYRDQIYSMPVWRENGYYIGIPSVMHEGDRTDASFDTVDCELAFATHAEHFSRIAPRAPFIARGEGSYPDGAFDCGCIYAAPPVMIDDRLTFYYFGSNGPHTAFRESSFARAFLEKDKYAFYEAACKNDAAQLSTRSMRLTGEDLRILAKITDGGSLDVAIAPSLTAEPYDGFAHATLTDVTGDWKRVTFDKSLSAIGAGSAVLRLTFRNTKVYAIAGDLLCEDARYDL